ncbi:MAG TPA: type III pantothenate kinase [Verrucomicrobiae bacterium]|jgi:type III pantothenate kinase|nr:type III pantothenate kinase [Verrucomicrobiae bacterium]
MIALFDVGNTHTHIGLADGKKVRRQINVLTAGWKTGASQKIAAKFLRSAGSASAAACSVVPAVTPLVRRFVRQQFGSDCFVLTAKTARGVGIDYPSPSAIGPDRLANAIAVVRSHGAPAIVVDFGTAVTFDVVDRRGCYVGGVIAPGLNVMTDYLHEKTALLPRIKIRDVQTAIGKNTEQAMLIGAVHGYRGLVRELILQLKQALGARRLPIVATGGYAELIAAKLPEITAVIPSLTLDGLRIAWAEYFAEKGGERPCQLTDGAIF